VKRRRSGLCDKLRREIPGNNWRNGLRHRGHARVHAEDLTVNRLACRAAHNRRKKCLREPVCNGKKRSHEQQLLRRIGEEERGDEKSRSGQRDTKNFVIGILQESPENKGLGNHDPQTHLRQKISDVS